MQSILGADQKERGLWGREWLKALKLAWIPRLLRTSDNSDWCIIPLSYKKILDFNEFKTLYSYDQKAGVSTV